MANIKFRGNTTTPTPHGATTAADAPLSNADIDANFRGLNDNKLEISGGTITGTLTVNGQLNADNLRLDGNAISSTNANGNVEITPGGTGNVLINGTKSITSSSLVVLNSPLLMLAGETSTAEITKDRGIETKWSGASISATNYIGNGTTTVTGTVTSTAGYATGDVITISGATGTEQTKLNGTWKITVVNATTFTFTVGSTVANGTYTSNLGTTIKSKNAFFGLDQSTGRFTFIPQADNTSEVFSGSPGDIEVSDIYLRDDTNPSHYLQVTNSADLTGNRILSVNVNDANRTISLSGDLTISAAATVSGTNTGDQTTITGNAGTATTWQTARTLTIGSTGKSVNGSANVSWTLAEIGAQAAGNYLTSTIGTNLTISNATSPNTYYLQFGDNSGWTFRFMTSVSGTPTTRYSFTDIGNFTATGNVTAFSDIRLKTDLIPIENALSKVNQLTGYTFTRTDTGSRQTGLVAQEVQKVLPEAVIEGEHLSLAYGNMVGLLVQAIKEQQSQIEKLLQEVEELKS
jgi:hypothetical protein